MFYWSLFRHWPVTNSDQTNLTSHANPVSLSVWKNRAGEIRTRDLLNPIKKMVFLAQFGRSRHYPAQSGFWCLKPVSKRVFGQRTCGTDRHRAARQIFAGATTRATTECPHFRSRKGEARRRAVWLADALAHFGLREAPNREPVCAGFNIARG